MVRNAMFQRVQLAARDRFRDLVALEGEGRPLLRWEEALGAYWDEYETLGDGPEARSPSLLMIEVDGRVWNVRQIIDDPEGNHDWSIVAVWIWTPPTPPARPVIKTQSFGPT